MRDIIRALEDMTAATAAETTGRIFPSLTRPLSRRGAFAFASLALSAIVFPMRAAAGVTAANTGAMTCLPSGATSVDRGDCCSNDDGGRNTCQAGGRYSRCNGDVDCAPGFICMHNAESKAQYGAGWGRCDNPPNNVSPCTNVNCGAGFTCVNGSCVGTICSSTQSQFCAKKTHDRCRRQKDDQKGGDFRKIRACKKRARKACQSQWVSVCGFNLAVH